MDSILRFGRTDPRQCFDGYGVLVACRRIGHNVNKKPCPFSPVPVFMQLDSTGAYLGHIYIELLML